MPVGFAIRAMAIRMQISEIGCSAGLMKDVISPLPEIRDWRIERSASGPRTIASTAGATCNRIIQLVHQVSAKAQRKHQPDIVVDPGIPRVMIGSIEPVEAALLAASGAATP